MRAEARMASEQTLPIVVVVSGFPLLSEAVEGALEGIAEVRSFPAGRGETADFLQLLQPDAVVVDSAEEAEAATDFARESRTMLVHVSLRDHRLRLMHNGRWQELPDGSASPERIRSAVAAGIYLRGVRV
ncbi:MAG: hypothetical protein ABI649_01665 [Gaiellaceae bacterium]